MHAQTKKFDWIEELHQTMVKSLCTTFGLDFLLFQDKNGGDVDTVHNVRQGIWATDESKQAYEQRGAYDSHAYHQDKNYIARGKSDKLKQQAGMLHDTYRNTRMAGHEGRQLDHVISAYEVHNDAGRVLSGLDGVILANQDSNLSSTISYANTKKSKSSMSDFIAELPQHIQHKQESIQRNQQQLAQMPEQTPQQRHEKRQLQDKIRKEEQNLEALNSLDTEAMVKADQKAREHYNQQINQTYYTSSRFLKNTAVASMQTGFKMGLRQSLGLVLAEVWFELKDTLPQIYKECKHNFQLSIFLGKLGSSLKNIMLRVQKRFKDLLTSFKDGFLGGLLASISTTLINIFFTTQKMVGKLIRESWQSLVQAAKLVFFNPQQLALGDLAREVARLVGAGISVALGVVLNQYLVSVLTFPLGAEIAAFVSALATGILTVGMTYFLDHSAMMQKVWNYLNQLKSKYQQILEHYQAVNAELDRYLLELAKLEFNMDPGELACFADSLAVTEDEWCRVVILDAEVKRRNLEMPFDTDIESKRAWLNDLRPKQ